MLADTKITSQKLKLSYSKPVAVERVEKEKNY
jgi:hypothetical protein